MVISRYKRLMSDVSLPLQTSLEVPIEGRLKGRAVEVMQRIDALAPKRGGSSVSGEPYRGSEVRMTR